MLEHCFSSLVKEVRIPRNPYLRSHGSVVSLLAVCWRVSNINNFVVLTLLLELAEEGNLGTRSWR
ncbi:hypothetical protein BJX66DRAFT_302371 [Aspergillus keveii]|uniref:Uncharacterized protein n=1 Tax=Aspergillus keveii TaxID=714993 RepID=A0ABR4G821_9EURO